MHIVIKACFLLFLLIELAEKSNGFADLSKGRNDQGYIITIIFLKKILLIFIRKQASIRPEIKIAGKNLSTFFINYSGKNVFFYKSQTLG